MTHNAAPKSPCLESDQLRDIGLLRGARRSTRGSTRNTRSTGTRRSRIRRSRTGGARGRGEGSGRARGGARHVVRVVPRHRRLLSDQAQKVVSFLRRGGHPLDLLELDLRCMFKPTTRRRCSRTSAAALRLRPGETPLEQLENELGWELSDALADPAAFADFSLDGLADIAAPVGLDWQHLLPVARPRRRVTRLVAAGSACVLAFVLPYRSTLLRR